MQYDKSLISHKLARWDRFITDYHLPDWETIPDFGLYMDQVIVLLEQYLTFIPTPAGSKEKFVTSSTINNYVRLKIMPAPVKRKYHRIHIAYLIMILTMKQSLSISDGAEGIRAATEQNCDNAVELLVIESALIAGFSKILAEKLIRLCGADTEDVLAAETPHQQP